MSGKEINSPDMIKDHHFYVAAANEPFYPREYGQPLPRLVTASRNLCHKYANQHFINDIPDECHTHRQKSMFQSNGMSSKPYLFGKNFEETYQNNPRDSRISTQMHSTNRSVPELEEALAATKIQAGYRGYRTRKEYGRISHSHEYNPKKFNESRLTHNYPHGKHHFNADDAATRIQASYRGYITRKTLHDDNISKPRSYDSHHSRSHEVVSSDDEFKTKAATIIQAGYRGYKTRKNLGHNLSEDLPHRSYSNKENEAEQAATKIQATYRGFAVRKQFKNPHSPQRVDNNSRLTDPNLAATKIQATFRGYKTRQHLSPHK